MITDGPRIEKYKIRGPALVIVAIFLFAALIRPFGLVFATYARVHGLDPGIDRDAVDREPHRGGRDDAFCVLLFVYLLNLPFQLWPQPNAHVILFKQFEEVISQSWIILRKLLHFR